MSTISATALRSTGRMLSLTQLTLEAADTETLQQAIRDYAERVPSAMRGLGILLDGPADVDLPAAVAAVKAADLPLVGVLDGGLSSQARQLNLASISPQALGAARSSKPAVASKAQSAAAPRSSRLITAPVRSGQQIYAEGTDLVVMAAVSAGAEVIADGCVHVYGVLRGRAIAGAKGDAQARVFCARQEAELIAVAGVYAVAEQIQDTRSQPVQAWLRDDKLVIEALPGSDR